MKRNILFVIESFTYGGAEKVLLVLLKYFNYDKYDVKICSIVDEGIYNDEVKKCFSTYSSIITYKGNCISRFWNRIKYKLVYSILPLKWVYKLFIPHGNDIEIAFCEGFATKLLAHSNAKKIAWIHTDLKDNPWPIELGLYKDVGDEAKTYTCFNKIVCVSKTVCDSFCELYEIKGKAITIYNPIDIDEIAENIVQKIKSRNDNSIHIISVGRLDYQKGYDRLLKVVKRLHDEGYPLQLSILGEGEERVSLEEYIKNNKISSFVSLLGHINYPYQQISESDIFVCSSRAEGFSLAIAEAMILGIPVVSTSCLGPKELLQYGKYGMLVDNSEDGIYCGLKNAINNMSVLNENIKSAQDRILEFSPKEILNKIESMLDTLILSNETNS